jgi:excisionase family DNA binding protein
MERLTLTVEEAGRLLGISRGLAYRAVRRGELPVVRIGRRYLVLKSELERMLVGTSEALREAARTHSEQEVPG